MKSAVMLPEVWRRKHLTRAEQQVVGLIAAGNRPKDVARFLGRAPATIRNHLYSATKKVGLHGRFELILHFHPPEQPPTATEASAPLEYAI